MASFYKLTENQSVIFTGNGEMLYYIPDKFFDLKVASIRGNWVDTIGIFTYAVFNKNGENTITKVAKCPTYVSCKPRDISRVKDFVILGSKEPRDYRVLQFKENDVLIQSCDVTQEMTNVEAFIYLLIRGNLPDNIPYDQVYEYVMKAAALNGVNYKVAANIICLLVSVLYRDINNLDRPFRLAGSDDMYAYKAINITKVPKFTSPYTAITSENASVAIATAMTTTSDTQSPLEKVMMT